MRSGDNGAYCLTVYCFSIWTELPVFFCFFLIVLGDGGDKGEDYDKGERLMWSAAIVSLQETACHQRFWLWQLQNGGMKENREVEGFQPWAQGLCVAAD